MNLNYISPSICTMKKNVALIAGGYSGEYEISMNSAKTISQNLDKERYNVFLISIDKEGWFFHEGEKKSKVNKSDFSVIQNGEKILFDFAYIIIHGAPGENGQLQGYLDMLDIPYSTGDHLNMAITFSKKSTTDILRSRGFKVANSVEAYSKTEMLEKLSGDEFQYPLFIKPDTSGSSLGISMVENKAELNEALDFAFAECDMVMAEEELKGVEVTCGVIEYNGELLALPLTEIVSNNKFFDYQAKYNQESEEITPARISESDTKLVQETSLRIYKSLNCKGICRVDFKQVAGEEPAVIEINTVPGMSAASLIPQMLQEAKIDLKTVLTSIIG